MNHPERNSISIVFYYRKTARYAFNVLTAAIEQEAHLKHLPIHFVKSQDELLKKIVAESRQFKQVLVAWSFYSPDFAEMEKEIDHIKQQTLEDNVIHLAGGVHATANPLQTLNAGFDYVAIGEGEQIIIDVIESLIYKHDLTSVKGLACIKQEKFHKNSRATPVDLDRFPACPSNYRKFGPVEITRGCIYACKFCQTPHINKAKFRHRSVNKILQAVNIMIAAGLKDYRFISPTALSYGSDDESVNHDALESLLGSVRATIGLNRRLFYGTFPSEVRPEHVDSRVLKLLKRYIDNDNLIIGAQSGSQAILDYARRGHSVECIEQAVRLSVQHGFKPNVDMLLGLPGETNKDVTKTMALAHKLIEIGARIHYHTFMPLPGTPFGNQEPGNISDAVQKQICSFTAQGVGYGNWKKQIKIAKLLHKGVSN